MSQTRMRACSYHSFDTYYGSKQL